MKRYNVLDIDVAAYPGPSSVHSLESHVYVGALHDQHDKLAELDALNYSGNGLNYIRAVNRAYAELVGPISERARARADADTAHRIASNLFVEVKAQLDEARDEGVDLIIISDGPDSVIQALAPRIGAIAAVGRPMADFERLAGLPSGQKLSGPDKRLRLRDVMEEKLGLILNYNATVDRAWGDATTDIPILEIAERPTVVNPFDPRMTDRAQQSGWPVIQCAGMPEYGDLSGRLVF